MVGSLAVARQYVLSQHLTLVVLLTSAAASAGGKVLESGSSLTDKKAAEAAAAALLEQEEREAEARRVSTLRKAGCSQANQRLLLRNPELRPGIVAVTSVLFGSQTMGEAVGE